MKKTRIILTFILIISMLSLLTGCGEPSGYFETEYFKCIENDNSITIIALTSEGIELEELVIPSRIRGKRVSSLGYSLGHKYLFYGEYIKVFLPGEVIGLQRHDLFLNGKDPKKIFLSTWPGFRCPTDNRLGGGGRYAPADYLHNYTISGYSMIRAANISYMNNYDEEINGGYHWVDDVDEGDKIKTIPADPEREGYQFKGWYTEPECITEWDFDTIPFPILENEEETGAEQQEQNMEEQQQEQDSEENNESENMEEEDKPSFSLYAKWIEG